MWCKLKTTKIKYNNDNNNGVKKEERGREGKVYKLKEVLYNAT